jgi:hypothetical protein
MGFFPEGPINLCTEGNQPGIMRDCSKSDYGIVYSTNSATPTTFTASTTYTIDDSPHSYAGTGRHQIMNNFYTKYIESTTTSMGALPTLIPFLRRGLLQFRTTNAPTVLANPPCF